MQSQKYKGFFSFYPNSEFRFIFFLYGYLLISKVEQDVMDKDKQITELVNRLIQYEQGQYGLSEAVHEIKECRALIRARDQ